MFDFQKIIIVYKTVPISICHTVYALNTRYLMFLNIWKYVFCFIKEQTIESLSLKDCVRMSKRGR